jgi:Fe2+ or Zn2+ uptake regulation protein
MAFLEEASAAIRASGGRFTPQRQMIVQLLENEKGHLDADKLYHLAYQKDNSISLATVYRTLNVLKEAGLIDQRRFSAGHKRAAYEPATTTEHFHLTCRQCGQVIEFQTGLASMLKDELEATLSVQVDHVGIDVEGLCQSCRRQRDEA